MHRYAGFDIENVIICMILFDVHILGSRMIPSEDPLCATAPPLTLEAFLCLIQVLSIPHPWVLLMNPTYFFRSTIPGFYL